ncbi:MAG: CBS domain-containing protein, partial [Acidobacteria bacterium]|nr:CBS domain-containing protein [Acidobacteriota bacterium]
LDSLSLWNDPTVHIHPDNPLENALELLSQTPGVLPVTSRSDARRLLGVITLDSILKGMHASRRF